MKVEFAPSFFKSFKRMINRQRWYWKIWDFFRYDLPKGIKNLVYFFPKVWKFRGYDYHFQLEMLKHSLVPLHKYILNGMEVDGPRLKKAAKILRAIEILDNITEDKYTDLAEEKLGYEINLDYFLMDEPEDVTLANRKIFNLSNDIQEKEWKELWKILKGQEHSHYVMRLDKAKAEGKAKGSNVWDTWFDGTGMRGWWD